MKHLLLFALPVLVSCGLFEPSPEPTAPFIFVELSTPDGFPIPDVDSLEVTTSAIVNGNPINDVLSIPLGDNELPTSFVIRFSEGIRGTNVDIEVRGFGVGGDLVSGFGTAVADASSVPIVGHFCGDGATNADRQESCDDGAGNSDSSPDACRTDCTAARCGDGVIDTAEACDDGSQNSDSVADACRTSCALSACGDGVADSGEGCDDGNNIDADGCEADCSLPACNNGIVDPEDFDGATCYEDSIPSTTGLSRTIRVFDVDGDNFQDIVHIDGSVNSLVVSFGDGTGNVSQTVTIPFNSPGEIPIFGFFGGNQGSRDIAISGSDNKAVIVRHAAPRTFTILNTPTASTGINDIVSGDFDSDGKDDLIVARGSGGLSMFKQLNNSFSIPALINFPVSGFGPNSIESSDLNGDNLLDLVVAEQLSDETSVLVLGRGKGDGTFVFSSISLPILTTSSSFEKIAIFDKDSDGTPEILILDENSPNSVLVSSVNVIPQSISPFVTQEEIQRIISADFDLDGKEDLAFYTKTSKLNLSLAIDGFSEKQIYTSLSTIPAIATGDFNGDGILDIISGDAVVPQNPIGMTIFLFNE